MTEGIIVKVLGDYGPFSALGKSISYQITIGKSSYLIDCGSPLFQQIGGKGLTALSGLIITHCHDDHKRWFSDIALYRLYASGLGKKLSLLATERINEDIMRASGPALETSLSVDSSSVVDIAYQDYVDFKPLGPSPKYRILSKYTGKGKYVLIVVDGGGNPVGPETAKIVISSKNGRPRLLFKDPEYKEWVEPESFYPFSSKIFYEENCRIYKDPEGFTIEAINAPVWHGLPGIGLRFRTPGETVVFSADTAHNVELWKKLYNQKRNRKPGLSKKRFEAASVLHGDINDFIERTWSEERFNEAMESFDNSVVIHDVAVKGSVVHTDYPNFKNSTFKKDKTILTHSPDTMTSEWILSNAGKEFIIKGDELFELVQGRPCRLNADVYHKDAGRYFVGYRAANGDVSVCETAGCLHLSKNGDGPSRELYKVKLYEDVGGQYFPMLEVEGAKYVQRDDGRVELVEITESGSVGRISVDQRERLTEIHEQNGEASKVIVNRPGI